MKPIMKKLFLNVNKMGNYLLATLGMLMISIVSFAQEEGGDLDVNVETDGGGGTVWYTNIWLWIGLAVFIIIIIAIVSAGKRR